MINDYICVICDTEQEYHDDEVFLDTENKSDCDVFIAPMCQCGCNKVVKKSASAHVFGAFRSYSHVATIPDSLLTRKQTYKETTEWESKQWVQKEIEKSETKGNVKDNS